MSKDPETRIAEQNRTKFRIPYPTRSGVSWHPVSTNEIHAVQMGSVVGLISGMAWVNGQKDLAVTALAALAGYAIAGRPFGKSLPHDAEDYVDSSVGLATIHYEPWWFLVSVGSALLLALESLG